MEPVKTQYDGGDVVRLKHDQLQKGLRAGDYGVLWGVYRTEPLTYEATFHPHEGQDVDLMFEADAVEPVTDIEQLSAAKHVRAIQQTLEAADKRLRQAAGEAP